jgi:hypothetical protein
VGIQTRLEIQTCWMLDHKDHEEMVILGLCDPAQLHVSQWPSESSSSLSAITLTWVHRLPLVWVPSARHDLQRPAVLPAHIAIITTHCLSSTYLPLQ